MSDPNQETTPVIPNPSTTNWSQDYEKKGFISAVANLTNYITVESGLITSGNYKEELPKWKVNILKNLQSRNKDMNMNIDCLLQIPNGVVSVYMTARYDPKTTKWFDWWKLKQFSKLLYDKPQTTEIPPLMVILRNQFVTAGLGLSSFDKLTEVEFDQFIERMRLSKEPLSATHYPFKEFKLKLVIHKKGLENETKGPNFKCNTIEDKPVPADLKIPLRETPKTTEQENNDANIIYTYEQRGDHAQRGYDSSWLDSKLPVPARLPIPKENVVGGRHRKSRRYTRKYKKSNKHVKSAKRLRSAKSRNYRTRK